ncbi:hypothetical protein BGZ92_008819 [Podila epicladia]|nr:hypothetical protein BGZ92_008819 [Podila epicladia]
MFSSTRHRLLNTACRLIPTSTRTQSVQLLKLLNAASIHIPLHLTRSSVPVISRAAFSSSHSIFNSSLTPTSDRHSSVCPDGTAHITTPNVVGLAKVTAKLMRDHVQRAPHPPSKDYVTLSFYQFRPIDADDLVKIQYYFLNDLRAMDVVGRIYVSAEGINAQISCPKHRVEEFKKYYSTHWPIFDKIRFNPAMSEGKAFRKLHVRIKGQLVADGIDNSTFDLYNEPTYLTPEEWHNELSSLCNPPILIDMRNHYESTIGHFENSIRPDVTTFKENIDAMLDICKGKEDQDIYMYCTGGIRCTRSGALLKSNGFKSVKMLQGGVTAYGRYIQDQKAAAETAEAATSSKKVASIYKGKNFTFDKRLGEPITDEVLAKCHICGTACDTYCNCSNMTCNLLMISCPSCLAKHEGTCGSGSCVEMVRTMIDKQREIEKLYPGMKARPGIKPMHEHRLRVRPTVVFNMRKTRSEAKL